MYLCQKPYKHQDIHTAFPVLLSKEKTRLCLPRFAQEKSVSVAAPPRAVLRGPGAASLLVLVLPRGLKLR